MRIPRFSWRKPAPRPAFVWRWVYPVVLVGFVVAAALLADAGLDNALRIKDGKVTQVETDPCKPGFLAEVDPTPTMLIIETDAKNDAIGMTALSLGADNQGGWVLQVPLETRTKEGKLIWQFWREATQPPPSSSTTTTNGTATTTTTTTTTRPAAQTSTTVAPLSAESVAAGKAALTREAGKLLGFSFPNNVLVLPAKTLASLMAPSLPVTLNLQTPVQTVSLDGKSQQTDFPAGPNSIKNEADVVKIFENQGPNASARLKRQGDLWAAWIGALRASPDALAAFKPESPALVTYVKALVTGPSEFRLLPVQNDFFDQAQNLFVIEADVAPTITLAAQMVPFPLMIEPGARLRTALFNGTTDCNLTLSAATRFAENGGQIDVLGNAATLDIAQSEVIYYSAELKTRVDAFAKKLGIDRVTLREGESAVDITVTLGADFKG